MMLSLGFGAGCAWGIFCMWWFPYRQIKEFLEDTRSESDRWRNRYYEMREKKEA